MADGQSVTLDPGNFGDDAGLEDLRRDMLRTIIIAVIGLTLAYDLWCYASPDRIGFLRWPFDLAMLAGAGAGLALLRRSLTLASLAVGSVLVLVVAGATYLDPASPILGSLTLVVVMAATIHTWRWSVATAFVFSGVVLVAERTSTIGSPSEFATLALVLTWLAAVLTWLGARPLETTLEWAWHSYARERRVAEELRDRQAELIRLNRSLLDAYDRIKAASREVERARRAAVQARLQRDRFAACVSHEMRTPLNLIIGFSEVMVESPGVYYGETLPPAYAEDVRAIYRNAGHLSQLVDDILDLAQIEADHLALKKTWTSVRQVVTDAALATRGLFQAKGLYLDVDVPADLPTVFADQTRVRQILINLLSNAARFTRVGGVAIGAQEADRDVVIQVRDTGAGIPEEYLQQVFEEFGQAETPLRHQVGGTGLGLTISKRLAELHGGNLWAESDPGAGSTFSFCLPKGENVAASSARPAWQTWVRFGNDADAARPVLAVGADPLCGRLLERHLEGFRVVSVAERAQAERVARRVRPAATIVVGSEHLGPDDVDGPKLVADRPTIRCRVSTTRASPERLGVQGYLTKPVRRTELRAQLKKLPSPIRSCLIVDDDPEMTRLLGRMIGSLAPRWKVRVATGGAEALEILSSWSPGLILLDLVMPEVDGYAVLQGLRTNERLRDVAVVIVSAYDGGAERISFDEIAVRLPRGLGAAELVRCLQAILGLVTAPAGDDPAQPEEAAGSAVLPSSPPRPAPSRASAPAGSSRR